MGDILRVIQHACGRINIPVPATVLGNTDTQVLQLRRLLEQECSDLALRAPWSTLIHEQTHTTTAAEDQGPIATIANLGFAQIIPQTFWDRTNKMPVIGPLSGQEWQAMKARTQTTTRFHWRLMEGSGGATIPVYGNLLVYPAPAAGLTWAFEFLSRYPFTNAANSAYGPFPTLDTDLLLMPEEIVLQGIIWRWKKEKGLDYAEDFRTYELQVKDAMVRDGGKPMLNMAGPVRTIKPGIFVPDESWSL